MSRREATDLAATAGCAVPGSVRKTTTLLVVGDQDIRKLGGKTKSSKHRKAEQLISEGQPIRVLTESDFRSLVESQASSFSKASQQSSTDLGNFIASAIREQCSRNMVSTSLFKSLLL